MAEFGHDDLTPHFILSGFTFHPDWTRQVMNFILSSMTKHGIGSMILTRIEMVRLNLLTKEQSKETYKGTLGSHELKIHPSWTDHYRGYNGISINDDLESFQNNLQARDKIEHESLYTFFLPMLTSDELKLVDEKNKKYMETYLYVFDADVDPEKMKNSDSKDKFLHCGCYRNTMVLEASNRRRKQRFILGSCCKCFS